MADQIALYLANCIAATAHDFDKRSAPKGERIRHRRLCETAADLLRGKTMVPFSGDIRATKTVEEVAQRLDEMAAILRRYEA